jgi:PAS domain S-box-containing protein
LFAQRLEHELLHRKEHVLMLGGIVEATGDAVIATKVDGRVTAWNSGAARLFGWTADEILGRSVERIVPDDELSPLQGRREQLLRTGEMLTYEVPRLRKDGSRVDVQVTLSPQSDHGGQITAIVSIMRDISERRQLEAQREHLLERERQARADAEFARALASELLGPVVQLLGYPIVIAAFLLHAVSLAFLLAFFITALLLGALLSVSALALEEFSFRRHARNRDAVRMIVFAILENLGYRQLNDFWRLQAFVDLARRRHAWGEMKRRGLGATPAAGPPPA